MRLTFLLIALGLLPLGPAAADEHDSHRPAQTIDYALILPANLPHMLRSANEQAALLGLDDSQRQAVRELMAEAPLQVFSRLGQAEKLEQAIARDLLHKQFPLAELEPRLDQLAALKRAASTAQIATINRLQTLLSRSQFRQLLQINGVPDPHAAPPLRP